MSLTEAWCRTYTLLVPEDEGVRRRAEVASHVHEARAAGSSPSRLAVETVLGLGADLLWSDGVRRGRGLVPLALAPFVDVTAGAILGGLLILVSFGLGALATDGTLAPLLSGLNWSALVLVLSGHLAGVVRRALGRHGGRPPRSGG